MSVREDLVAARALIADAQHWTRGAYSRALPGKSNDDADLDYAYCAAGAVSAAITNSLGPEHTLAPRTRTAPAFDALRASIPPAFAPYGWTPLDPIATAVDHVITFNENSTHSDVLALFDRAISKLEADVDG